MPGSSLLATVDLQPTELKESIAAREIPTPPGDRPGYGSEAATVGWAASTPVRAEKPAGLAGQLGDYEVLSEIARGGMGVVYRARQLSLNREVALKMILPGRQPSPIQVRRFRTEAEAAAHLDHPHIVPIFEVGEIDGLPYFTMKLIEGGSLDGRLEEFRLPSPDDEPRPARALVEQRLARLTKLLATVARAVHHAHQRGVLHRDLKPANILLDRESNPLVADFGLAKRFNDSDGPANSDNIVGTAAYMAPEQAATRQDELTTAADVYALGAILYHLLTGRAPLIGSSFIDTLLMVVNEQPVPPRQRNPHVPADLEAICLKCLAKAPTKRYDSALALAEDLERFAAGEAITLRPRTARERAWRWARRNRLAAAALAAVAVLAVVVSIGSPIAALRIAAARDRANENAREAERQAHEAERQAHEASVARDRADENARKAEHHAGVADAARTVALTALDAEKKARGESHRLLVSGYVSSGSRALDGGDLMGALVWYGEALHLDAGDLAREEPHRVRLAAVLRRCPRLAQVWFAAEAGPAALSPDGRRAALAHNETARLWDVTSGKEIAAPLVHRDRIERVAFSPDGSRALTASADGTARLWDAATGQPSGPPLAHGKPVLFATFSPDGSRVATVGADRAARVWNARTGKLLAGPLQQSAPMLYASFSRDGKRLLTCGGDTDTHKGEIGVWDLPPGKSASRIVPTTVVHHWAAFVDATHFVSVGGRRMLAQWDLTSGSPVRMAGRSISGVHVEWDNALSPDATRILTLDGSTAQVCDLATGKPAGPALLHGGEALFAAFSPDGKRVVTGSRDRTVRIWDAASGQPLSSPLRHARPVYHAVFSTDGQRLLTVTDDGMTRLWDLIPRDLVQPLQTLASTTALSPDGRVAAVVEKDGAVKLRDSVAGKVVGGPWKLAGPIAHLAFSSDGRRLLAVGDKEARVWDVGNGKPATPAFPHAGSVQQALFTPDGSRVALVGGKELLQVFDAATGLRQSSAPMPTRASWRGLTLSPDGTSALIARSARNYEVRDVVSGVVRGDLFRHAAVGTFSVFSPDGKRVAVATGDGSTFLWDVAMGKLAAPLMQHGQPLRQVTFSGDGRRLATVAEDRSVRVWDTATGLPLSPLLPHAEPIVGASLSADGSRLVVRLKSNAALVWDVGPDNRPEDDLRALTQLLSGLNLDDGSGGFESLDLTRLRDSWPRLRAKYPKEFGAGTP